MYVCMYVWYMLNMLNEAEEITCDKYVIINLHCSVQCSVPHCVFVRLISELLVLVSRTSLLTETLDELRGMTDTPEPCLR